MSRLDNHINTTSTLNFYEKISYFHTHYDSQAYGLLPKIKQNISNSLAISKWRVTHHNDNTKLPAGT